ncbi:TPA: hypothetical protein HA246_02500 [Candidatus Woesearchaeota archaeon]|nr:hypothetical protein [Candidatus Woesearchaeota archaeon]
MKEKTLFKLAMICLVIGLPALYFLSLSIEIKEADISKISLGDVDKQVKLVGKVASVRNFEKASIIEITQPSKIKVIMFVENVTLEDEQEIEVFGKIGEYEGKPEIIADVVRKKIK